MPSPHLAARCGARLAHRIAFRCFPRLKLVNNPTDESLSSWSSCDGANTIKPFHFAIR
ncbi:hypothetical protein EMIT0111MI5_10063 [Burkholderia sp. IT-111MI5]